MRQGGRRIFDLHQPHCERARKYHETITGKTRYRCGHIVSVAFGRAFLLMVMLTGCSTPPKPDPLSTWADMDTVTTVDCQPVALPPPGRPGVTEVDGEEVIYYPVAEGERLEARLTALNANTEIAEACAAALKAAETERRALIEAGRRTEQRANYLADELWRESGDHLAERREHMLDNWIHRLIMLVGIGIGL